VVVRRKEDRVSTRISAEVIVVGAGIAGALAATELARAGVKVAILEAGPTVDRAAAVRRYQESSVRVPESAYPNLPYAPRPTVIHPNAYYVQKGPENFGSTYERLVGGSTWHWLGTALRLVPNDFRMRSAYGVGHDWPIAYDDLEPWYGKAEHEIGVSGVDDPALGAPRSTTYPMPPIPQSYLAKRFASAAQTIGLQVSSTPQARNSVARDGRPACCGNGSCIPICPIGAKYDASVHVAKARKLGARLVAPAVVNSVEVTANGVTVRFLHPDGRSGVAYGRILVLAAHGIEIPKLMLMSTGPAHPAGLGNQHDLVGRFLMDHPTQLSWAVSKDPVYPYRGPLSTAGVEMLRDGPFRRFRGAFRVEIGNDGWSWPAGDATVQARTAATNGELGAPGLEQLRERFERQLRLASLVEPLPDRENRVTLSDRRDALGIPRPSISYRTHPYATAGLSAARKVHELLFEAVGATEIQHADSPFGAGHIMGTCRMGNDPASSVVDRDLRVHRHERCFVISTAVFPSVGTANPTLTLAALSLRAARTIQRYL
jgi:choline dehydrogenase-like flavoprotein